MANSNLACYTLTSHTYRPRIPTSRDLLARFPLPGYRFHEVQYTEEFEKKHYSSSASELTHTHAHTHARTLTHTHRVENISYRIELFFFYLKIQEGVKDHEDIMQTYKMAYDRVSEHIN